MKILIYDDNKKDIDQLNNNITTFFNSIHLDFNIEICPDTDFLYENIKYFDLLFLDIEINHQNGIEIGMNLTKTNHNCRIIITTNFKKYSIDGYKINADRYFIKPIDQNEFNIEMKTIVNRYLKQFMGFFDNKISHTKIFFKDILYIEFFNRKTMIHYLNGTIKETPYTLKHWIELLNTNSFAQIHKALIINLDYIDDLKSKEVKLINKESLPLSRHYKKMFMDKYISNLSSCF